MKDRIIAIGDIHGCSSALSSIIESISPTKHDTIVTLGDVIDWGPDSRGVVDKLIHLSKQCTLVPLLGNHEEMLLYADRSRSALDNWLHCGGQETLHSYGPGALLHNIPDAHVQFLK